MTGRISEKVAASRAGTITEMISGIRSLPLSSEAAFLDQPHMVAAGESYLRRALEAVLDWGRHILAKGFGRPVAEHKAIPVALRECGVLSRGAEERLLMMAGYRNRMVHFYNEVTPSEIYKILTRDLGDLEAVCAELRHWMNRHPDLIDTSL